MNEINNSTASTLKAKLDAKIAAKEEATPAETTATDTAPKADATAPVQENKQVSDTETLKAELRKEIEADLRKQFSQVGRREQKIQEQLKEIESLKAVKDILKSGKKLDALTALGISYDDLTSEILNGTLYQPQPTQQLPAEVQELMNWKKQQEAANMKQVETQAKEFIKTKASELDSEFVLAHSSGIDAVYSLASVKYQEDGEVDLEEVIKEVETNLHDEYFAKFLETKKAKSLLDKRYQEYVDQKRKEKGAPGTLTSSMAPAGVISDTSDEVIPQKLKGTREGLAAGLRKQAASKKK